MFLKRCSRQSIRKITHALRKNWITQRTNYSRVSCSGSSEENNEKAGNAGRLLELKFLSCGKAVY